MCEQINIYVPISIFALAMFRIFMKILQNAFELKISTTDLEIILLIIVSILIVYVRVEKDAS